jgi:hypothetical protein
MNILTLIFGLELRKEVSTLRRKYDVTNAARNTTKKAEAVISKSRFNLETWPPTARTHGAPNTRTCSSMFGVV